MNWQKVIAELRLEARSLRERAQTAFPHDLDVQREMQSRAALADMMANALAAGLR